MSLIILLYLKMHPKIAAMGRSPARAEEVAYSSLALRQRSSVLRGRRGRHCTSLARNKWGVNSQRLQCVRGVDVGVLTCYCPAREFEPQ